MGLISLPIAFAVAFGFLGAMLYKRVNLGITLNATALLLAALSVDWQTIPVIIYETSIEPLTISVVLATFGIMLLSQLYKETKVINHLSESAGNLIKNSKIVSSVLPAVLGFLPVAGGALMSAPLVDSQAENLGLKPERKAYVNVWFRHTIFPVYPLSQVLIVTAALTGIAIPLIVVRQIPVVVAMVIVGFIIGFWRVSASKSKENPGRQDNVDKNSNLRKFLIAFSPILATIVAVFALDAVFVGLGGLGFDVVAATFMGLLVLIAISKPGVRLLAKPLGNWEIYGITAAAYGAFLLKGVVEAGGVSDILKASVASGNLDIILLLTIVPAILGFVTASPSGAVAISVPILAGILTFSAKTAALLYMSAYLGYLIVPSHLCFAFTVDYFNCSMKRVYRYIIPSFAITFATALAVYFLV